MLSWGTTKPFQDQMGDVSTWGFADPVPESPLSAHATGKAAHLDWGPAPQEAEPPEDGHVHWSIAAAQHAPIKWGSSVTQGGPDAADETVHEEERARKASGRSRKGSYFPGHNPVHDQQAAARFRHRPDSGEQQQMRGNTASSASRASTAAAEKGCRSRPTTAFHAATSNRGGSAGSSQEGARRQRSSGAGDGGTAASLAFGYQPYSLKDYREQHYDAKREEYWTLGKLQPEPESSELHHKKEVAEKVRGLSAAIRERNHLAVVGTAALRGRSRSPSPNRKNASPSRSRRDASPPKQTQSARERAVQYAHALPKQAPPAARQPGARRSVSTQKRGSVVAVVADAKGPEVAAVMAGNRARFSVIRNRPTQDLDLEQLRALHAQQKAQIEAMRRELGRSLAV